MKMIAIHLCGLITNVDAKVQDKSCGHCKPNSPPTENKFLGHCSSHFKHTSAKNTEIERGRIVCVVHGGTGAVC